jgi:hypothetical protein
LGVVSDLTTCAGRYTRALQSRLTKDDSTSSGLVETANKVTVRVLGMEVPALLDTCSTVSTVSRAFSDTHLNHKPLVPLSTVMTLECADGKPLSYDGYVDFESVGGDIEGDDHLDICILWVIPDSNYNTEVPLLMGTNIHFHAPHTRTTWC